MTDTRQFKASTKGLETDCQVALDQRCSKYKKALQNI
ncbi:hypothetical protein YSA_08614 [Pseudomonas putida ND6]|uniref:Uncharacterized protein n=1 Tax=Pseudomonas putida ND6 TaxID=231023 RepID=I3V106_PSEPU|nr:hypothetical protein YSA_08614 [Pseudomonas putida ND6]